jgi:hypothetical protein
VQHKAPVGFDQWGRFARPAHACSNGQQGLGAPVAACPSVQILALQPHLQIELEVVFLPIRAYGIVYFKLLIVFVHFEFAAGASLSLDRSGELCTLVLGNLAIGERRQRRYGEYRHRCNQPHEQVPPGVFSESFALTSSR